MLLGADHAHTRQTITQEFDTCLMEALGQPLRDVILNWDDIIMALDAFDGADSNIGFDCKVGL